MVGSGVPCAGSVCLVRNQACASKHFVEVGTGKVLLYLNQSNTVIHIGNRVTLLPGKLLWLQWWVICRYITCVYIISVEDARDVIFRKRSAVLQCIFFFLPWKEKPRADEETANYQCISQLITSEYLCVCVLWWQVWFLRNRLHFQNLAKTLVLLKYWK